MPSASCCTRPSGPAAVPSSPAPGPSLRTAGNEGSGHLDSSLQTHLVASPLSPRSPELARSGSQSPLSAKRPCTDTPLLGPTPRARPPPDVRASWAVCSGCRPGRGRTNAAQTSGHRAVPEARCRRRGLLACGCGRRARDDVPATAASHARTKDGAGEPQTRVCRGGGTAWRAAPWGGGRQRGAFPSSRGVRPLPHRSPARARGSWVGLVPGQRGLLWSLLLFYMRKKPRAWPEDSPG